MDCGCWKTQGLDCRSRLGESTGTAQSKPFQILPQAQKQCGVALRSAVLWELWQLYASQAQPADKRTGREDLQLSL